MVGLWLVVGESSLILKLWWLNSEDCGMRDKGGRRSCTSSSAFPVQVEHLTIVWKHLTIFAWVYLIQEIRDSLIIITASPGFIVRAGREPKNMIEIDQIRRTPEVLHLASLFTGAPQVVYRSVIIFGGINWNRCGEVSERFSFLQRWLHLPDHWDRTRRGWVGLFGKLSDRIWTDFCKTTLATTL